MIFGLVLFGARAEHEVFLNRWLDWLGLAGCGGVPLVWLGLVWLGLVVSFGFVWFGFVLVCLCAGVFACVLVLGNALRLGVSSFKKHPFLGTLSAQN